MPSASPNSPNLTFSQPDVCRFADDHTQMADLIRDACKPNPALTKTMPSAYGTVGAAFTGAVTGFCTAIQAAGAKLAARYDEVANQTHISATAITDTDTQSASAISQI